MVHLSKTSNKYPKLFLTILLALIFFNVTLYSQIRIKEKVSINPNYPPIKINKTTEESLTVSPPGIYLRVGGALNVRFAWPNPLVGPGDWEIRIGQQVLAKPDTIHRTYYLGTYGQWSYLPLTMHNDSISFYAGQTFQMDERTSGIIGPESIGILTYRVLEETTFGKTDIAVLTEIVPDSSLEALPPLWVLNDLVGFGWRNPYERDPAPVMEVLIPGRYRLVVTNSSGNGRDDLLILQPVTTTLLTSAQGRVGDRVMLGTFAEREQIELALVSRSSALLAGQQLYPHVRQLSPAVWELVFEDWTDLDFDDLTVRVEIDADSADHLELRSASDMIWYGDTVSIAITPADAQGRLSPIGPDYLYEFAIELPDSLRRYGELIYREEAGYIFEHIALKNGISEGLQFAANGVEPESIVVLRFGLKAIYVGEIIAGATNKGGNKTGVLKRAQRAVASSTPQRGDVVLQNDWELEVKNSAAEITLDITGPKEIWPYKAVSAGYNPITNVKIKVTNGAQPQANQSVKITIKRIERTGGHDHPNSSDLTLWGRISINGVKGNPVTAYTDQNGEITTEEVRSSEFGGEYFIEAYIESKPDIKDKVSFIVRVPGLSLLPENSSYTKIGGTDKHFGPPIYQTDNNHWINSNALVDLDSAAVSFSRDHLNKTGIMRINDISLPNGGLFDYRGTWNSPHISHRVGKDVDIENKNIAVLLRVMTRFGWLYIKEPANFYPHFRYVR